MSIGRELRRSSQALGSFLTITSVSEEGAGVGNSPSHISEVCGSWTHHCVVLILLGCIGLSRVNVELKRKEVQPV